MFEVAAKDDSARLPTAAPLKARKVRRDNLLRDADVLSPQGGLEVAGDVFFSAAKIALSERSRTIENRAQACQIPPA